MSRRRPVDVSAIPLHAPEMTLAEAIVRLPTDSPAFNVVRYRWIRVVRGHPLLTAAQRHVALAIAQQYINRSPQNPWFNSAWAAHQTIADQTGYTRRTVVSAMAALRNIGLLAINSGGGLNVPGGRTDRYTLRTDRLDLLESVALALKQNGLKNFRRSPDNQFDESGEKIIESGEIGDQMMGNPSNEDVKGLHTTLLTHLSNSPKAEFCSQSEAQPVATSQLGNGRKEESERVTAHDHRELAFFLGQGNVERGYNQLGLIDVANVDELALRYRLDPSSREDVRAEARRLLEAPGRPA